MLTNSKPKGRATASDLLSDIRAKLATTADPEKQNDLLCLGIDLLRRRQVDRPKPMRKGAR